MKLYIRLHHIQLNHLIPKAEGKINEQHLERRFSPHETLGVGTASFQDTAHTSVALNPKGFSELEDRYNLKKCSPSARVGSDVPPAHSLAQHSMVPRTREEQEGIKKIDLQSGYGKTTLADKSSSRSVDFGISY